MPIQLQGKEYKLVAERLTAFHDNFGDNYCINTFVIPANDSCIMGAKIIDRNSGEVVATGHAQNFYTGKDKVMEKTETTACGRALALFHKDLMGSEIASADEIATWVQHGNDQALLDHVAAVREHWESIVVIKESLTVAENYALADKDNWTYLESALEAWRELGEDVMKVLWRAPSKGGIFTTLERKLLDEASTEDFKRRKANG